jgi:PKD repeat protein
VAELASSFGEPNTSFPQIDSPGPPPGKVPFSSGYVPDVNSKNRGDFFFYGGGSGTSIARAFIGLSSYTSQRNLIDTGTVEYVLSAYLGGSGSQNDGVTIYANFYGQSVGSYNDPNNFCYEGPPACTPKNTSQTLGPVTVSDRANQTGLLSVSISGVLLPGTRFVEIIVTMTGTDGTCNDAYMDNLSFVAFANSKANFSDSGIADTHTATIDWGDVAPPPVPLEAGIVTQVAGFGTVEGNHAYADDGTYAVNLTVTDNDGGSAADDFTVTVNNVAPVITGVPAAYAHTQSSTQLVATYVDAGVSDTHTATIDWGDGQSSGPFAVSSGQVFGTHLYSDPSGSFPQTMTIKVRVEDDDGGFQEIFSIVTGVTLQIQSINGGPDQTAVEGSGVNFSGSHGVVINPGGGTVPSSITFQESWDFGDDGSASGASPSHVYADNGVYTARYIVEARSEGTLVARGEDLVTVTVNNANPSVSTPGGSTINEGGPASGSVSGSRTYADNGSYPVSVCVTDDDSGVDCSPTTIDVNNVAPSLGAIGASPNANARRGRRNYPVGDIQRPWL